jgi:hypothetical protein
MSEKSGAALVEEWQTGAFLLLGSVGIGVVLAAVGGSVGGRIGGVSGLVLGPIAGFLVLSYLVYGR